MAKGMTSLESDVREVQMIFDTDTNKEVVNDPTKKVEPSLHAGHGDAWRSHCLLSWWDL